jgi:hypothetical protein
METLEMLLQKGYTMAERDGDTIGKNQIILFSNGYKAGYLENLIYSERRGGFVLWNEYGDHEDRWGRKYFVSTTILNKPQRKARPKQTDTSKMKEIEVAFETEKAYAVYDGCNGKITRGNSKEYYRFYPKSLCVEENGKVYAPYYL